MLFDLIIKALHFPMNTALSPQRFRPSHRSPRLDKKRKEKKTIKKKKIRSQAAQPILLL